MELVDSSPPVTKEQIDAFEGRHGILLPDDYRCFLLAHNGGCPIPDRFAFPGPSGGGSVVNQFFALDDGHPYDLDASCKSLDWPEAYHAGVIQIGVDTGGSGLFLGTRGMYEGAVLFVDREVTLRKAHPVILAHSFEEFLASLQPS